MIQLALRLSNLVKSGNTFFFHCQPEVFDFTVPDFSGELIFHSFTEELRLKISSKELISLLGLLNAALFDNHDITIIGWNIKNFVSFVKFHTKAKMELGCNFIDLKLLEAFFGITKDKPGNFAEAMIRTKIVMSDDNWSKAKLIWQKIHIPLVFDVIPFLETQGIYNIKNRNRLYSYYEIEGQANGRLKCSQEYKHSFIPHTMGPEQKEIYRPGADEVFMYFDYHNMEVSMLQWLSNDDRLGQVLALDEDFYTVVFKLVSGNVCDNEKKRDVCKNFVLPIIYGASAGSLSKALGISEMTAENIVDRIYNLFPTSLKWVQECQDSADFIGVDYFGRKRRFAERRHWAVRNFAVQSPASLVCLEKLIALHAKLKEERARLACHIHDGYLLYVNKSVIKMVAEIAKEVLEQDSLLCPGLRLKVSCKAGYTLQDLKCVHLEKQSFGGDE